ncbi:MAG: cyclic nucleotide-binding domain-containing protein [Pseudanabaena sp.]
MTTQIHAIQELLDRIPLLQTIDRQLLTELSDRLQPLRYRMGQVILRRETMPAQIMFLWEGQARLLAQIQQTTSPITLEILKPGAIIGWASLIRNLPCETAIASIESICFALDTRDFLQFCDRDPAFKAAFSNQISVSEVFDLLTVEMERRASPQQLSPTNPRGLATSHRNNLLIRKNTPHKTRSQLYLASKWRSKHPNSRGKPPRTETRFYRNARR